ncbi:D-aminopeptidase [Nannocystis exedens]|uniref:D-aminopeptidase n=2 Tax=Nannocystis exedens TaxID=54 RepID=A0A1I2E3R7_9BACT|nr:aminopeptidase [Nannocystis exedens]SFE87485.1 D-aminopeptidase [Nannocystis exedens]
MTAALLLVVALLGCRPRAVHAAPAGATATEERQHGTRARALGVPFDGTPGPHNAITDVAGLEVGHATIIAGAGDHAVRTGVTAILPRGKRSIVPAFAGWFALNGNGEMTGTTWIEEGGLLGGPVLLTNTNSVGVVRDAIVAWGIARFPGTDAAWELGLPVVGETYDGFLNDVDGFHVTREHAFAALDSAASGPVAEGNVGGGTGMMAYQFKGGIGTASRRLSVDAGGHTVGVLVQANYGQRDELVIAGVPVGREIADLLPVRGEPDARDGSIIVIVATDAPLLPHQLKRLARRVPLGIGRVGGTAHNSSGDIFLALSTANADAAAAKDGLARAAFVPNDALDPLLTATVQATEEAIVNALTAAETMTGVRGSTAHALPHARLRAALKKYGRLTEGRAR